MTEPDPRPLGGLALGVAILGAAAAPTYFLSAFTYLAAALAVTLGLIACGIPRTRALGTAAVVVAVLAVVVATAVLLRF